jgi:hypothetical protein
MKSINFVSVICHLSVHWTEDDYLLGRDDMKPGRTLPTFLLSWTGRKTCSLETSVKFYVPERSNVHRHHRQNPKYHIANWINHTAMRSTCSATPFNGTGIALPESYSARGWASEKLWEESYLVSETSWALLGPPDSLFNAYRRPIPRV